MALVFVLSSRSIPRVARATGPVTLWALCSLCETSPWPRCESCLCVLRARWCRVLSGALAALRDCAAHESLSPKGCGVSGSSTGSAGVSRAITASSARSFGTRSLTPPTAFEYSQFAARMLWSTNSLGMPAASTTDRAICASGTVLNLRTTTRSVDSLMTARSTSRESLPRSHAHRVARADGRS